MQPKVADIPPAGGLLSRVPGRARSRAQANKEFDESVEALKRRYNRTLWPLFIPKAEDVYRWRVQLECGCVREVLTLGETSYPDQCSDEGPLTGQRLPRGEYWCTEHRVEKPYGGIAEWGNHEIKEIPADPEEPKYGMSPEEWALVRHTEPSSLASWRVRLSCGHSDTVLTDVDFTPGDDRRVVSVARRDELRRSLDEHWAQEGPGAWPEEGPRRDHMRRMLDLRMPRPEPEQECAACAYAKTVTGYQRIGWLVPRFKPAARPTDREKVGAPTAAPPRLRGRCRRCS